MIPFRNITRAIKIMSQYLFLGYEHLASCAFLCSTQERISQVHEGM
uniref:Uncharacterized protein n=1 Tax=Arundo donax TaxID=35708 RepID=A0A0A9C7S7_ARUDO